MSDTNWYEGEFKNGNYDGKGLRHYRSGSKYLGDWKNGKPNGSGIMLFSNNDVHINFCFAYKWYISMFHQSNKCIQ